MMIYMNKQWFTCALLLVGCVLSTTHAAAAATATANTKKKKIGMIPDAIRAQVEVIIHKKTAEEVSAKNFHKKMEQVLEVKTLAQEKEEKEKVVVKDKEEKEEEVVMKKEKEIVPEKEKEQKVTCEDTHLNKVECKEWAWFGECEKNTDFMNKSCQKSCGLCPTTKKISRNASSSSSSVAVASSSSDDDDDDECHDWFATCTEWAEKGNEKVDNLCYGHWHSNKGTWLMTGAYVVEFCPKACHTCDIHLDDRDISLNVGVPQSFPGMEDDKELKNLIKGKVAETRAYIQSLENEEIKAVCKMSHPHCARYALSSDCQDQVNHPLMKYGCAAACQTCDKLVDNNGIFEADHMWTNALRDFNEQKTKSTNNVVKKIIEVSAA
mmetsp:Transcript_58798/g.65845  ORF Transcript_58798/g.65845 Transcript_58798/m.65845 type:complete len:380 (+) Transcript_58798:44-1183(+)